MMAGQRRNLTDDRLSGHDVVDDAAAVEERRRMEK